MTLVLEIEYLSGVSFAAIGPDSHEPEWPPQPDRVFSALTATWAAGGRQREHADALEWLEQLPPPRILASQAEPRTEHDVYVPPNDYTTPRGELSGLKWYRDFLDRRVAPPEQRGQKNAWLEAWNVMPDQRKRSGLKARAFPAARPDDPVVRLFWADAHPAKQTFEALDRLARDTSYVGHSASLTRCRFLLDLTSSAPGDAVPPKRRVYAGRFAELRSVFDAGQRPRPGSRVGGVADVTREAATIFGARWMLLEHVGGDMPDIRACAIVARTLRDALLSGYRQIGLEREVPTVISGHAPDGTPSRDAHLAIIPLAFAGYPHADGRVLAFALVPPRDSDILEDDLFRRALTSLAPVDPSRNRRCLTLRTREAPAAGRPLSILLSPTTEINRRSLDPAPYVGPADVFATVTPVVLDRHLKEKGADRQVEIAAQIAAACRNVGLPEPVQVVPHCDPSFEGVPSAYPSGRSPGWVRWRLPPFVDGRQVTHAVIRFRAPVTGPVLLGAGRFVGLGLCRRLDAS